MPTTFWGIRRDALAVAHLGHQVQETRPQTDTVLFHVFDPEASVSTSEYESAGGEQDTGLAASNWDSDGQRSSNGEELDREAD